MIFDRTQADVEKAKRLIEEKVKTFSSLIESEIEILERGCATVNTLNRIETSQYALMSALNLIGYNVSVQTKSWTVDMIFGEEDFKRILSNIDILRSVFANKKDTPETPSVSYSYITFNKIEKILFDLQSLEENIRKSFVYSGEIYSGER